MLLLKKNLAAEKSGISRLAVLIAELSELRISLWMFL